MYKCTEQDQSSELPLIAGEARAAYDAQAATKEGTASSSAVSPESATTHSSELGTPDSQNIISTSLNDGEKLMSPSDVSDLALNTPTLTGKGDGLTYRWIGPEDMDKMAFPNIFLKLISSYFAGAYDQVND
ncbi:hypothetical protein D3C74_365020 [compost metagenome]